MGAVSDIRVCSYFMPSEEVAADPILASGAHVYYLQKEGLQEDALNGGATPPLIQRLTDQQWHIFTDLFGAVVCLDPNRFTYRKDQVQFPHPYIEDNVTGKFLCIMPCPLKKDERSGCTKFEFKMDVYSPISDSSSRFELEYFSSLPKDSEGYQARDGGFLKFNVPPEFSHEGNILQLMFSALVWLIGTVVQSIFMTRYDAPSFELETKPSEDNTRQPLITRITFPAKASLIDRIGAWFRGESGSAAHVENSSQVV